MFNDQAADDTEDGDDYQDDDDFNVVLDLENVEEPTFQLLPPGTYDGIIEDIEAGYSSKNNKMLTWRIVVQDLQGKDRTLYFFTMLEGDGLGRTRRTIRRVSPDYDLKQFVPANLGEELSGFPCRVVVRIRPYQGERRNNVTDVLAPAAGVAADD